jgi:hypothetical protein
LTRWLALLLVTLFSVGKTYSNNGDVCILPVPIAFLHVFDYTQRTTVNEIHGPENIRITLYLPIKREKHSQTNRKT